jgi:hypothetical protein
MARAVGPPQYEGGRAVCRAGPNHCAVRRNRFFATIKKSGDAQKMVHHAQFFVHWRASKYRICVTLHKLFSKKAVLVKNISSLKNI